MQVSNSLATSSGAGDSTMRHERLETTQIYTQTSLRKRLEVHGRSHPAVRSEDDSEADCASRLPDKLADHAIGQRQRFKLPSETEIRYSLRMSTSLDRSSLHRFLEQFTDTFTPELAEHFATLPPSPELQARLDELGSKSNEGTLTDAERSEYETYVEAMDVIALLRVKSQIDQRDGSGS